MLVSPKHQHESTIDKFISPPIWASFHLPPHPTPLGCYRTLVWVPWITQQIPTGYVFYIWSYTRFHVTLSIHLTSLSPHRVHQSWTQQLNKSSSFTILFIIRIDVKRNKMSSHMRVDTQNVWYVICIWIRCCCLVTKPCPILLWALDCSSPGSSVHGISQARILECVAISFSRGSSWPRVEPGSLALQVGSLPLIHQGSLCI